MWLMNIDFAGGTASAAPTGPTIIRRHGHPHHALTQLAQCVAFLVSSLG